MEYKEYREEIDYIFRRASRGGFIDYRSCGYLEFEIGNLLMSAISELTARSEYKELFKIACKAFIKWGNASMDDSGGETQGFCSDVMSVWDVVYAVNDKSIPRRKMLDWFIGKIGNDSVIDYMEEYLYKYISDNFKEPEFLEIKRDLYERLIAEGEERLKSNPYDYQSKMCREYMLILLADMKKPIEEIREYATTVDSVSVKELMAEIEKQYGNFDRAIELYKELAAEEASRGWSRGRWHLKLKDIYKESGNQDNYEDELKTAMRCNLGSLELWEEYKALFTEEEWPEKCSEYFEEFSNVSYLLCPVYKAEGRLDLIMDSAERFQDVSLIKHYEKKLKTLYPERCVAVLSAEVIETACKASNRKEYRNVARLLKLMQGFPTGNEKSSELAELLRTKYPRRPAFLDELSSF